MKNSKHRQGFTLVELSIVMVIIGLIIGGILVGRNLIRASELRSVITDYEKYRTAVFTFKSKYDALPGDMPDAQNIWGAAANCTSAQTTTATCNGGGNNLVGQNNPSGNIGNEAFLFWKHLANAGLVAGNFSGITDGSTNYSATSTNSPSGKIPRSLWFVANWAILNSVSWAFDGEYRQVFEHGLQRANSDPATDMLSPSDAFSIDSKSDDGMPGVGAIRVRITTDCVVKADGITQATYSDTNSAKYNSSLNLVKCVLVFPKVF